MHRKAAKLCGHDFRMPIELGVILLGVRAVTQS